MHLKLFTVDMFQQTDSDVPSPPDGKSKTKKGDWEGEPTTNVNRSKERVGLLCCVCLE